MIRYVFRIVTLCFIACGSSIAGQKHNVQIQNNDNDEILWSSNKKLIWSDFSGKVPKDKGVTIAETQCKITITNAYWDNDLPKYELSCFFVKSPLFEVCNFELLNNK